MWAQLQLHHNKYTGVCSKVKGNCIMRASKRTLGRQGSKLGDVLPRKIRHVEVLRGLYGTEARVCP